MDQSVQEMQQDHPEEVVAQDTMPACGGRPKPDGEESPAGEVGWFLQREREKRGLSLEDVGEFIGVHPYHIEAIEYGDMTCMPQRIEALQMISAYADFLGFHPEPLLEHYVSILPAPELAPKHHPASPAPLSSARILAFGKKLPKLPPVNFKLPSVKLDNIKLPSIKMDNNGVVASVAAAFMLFAGTTWIIAPGKDAVPLTQVVAEMPSATEKMPEAPTQDDMAAVKITDVEIPDQPLTKTDDLTVATTAREDAQTVEIGDPLGEFIKEQVGGDATVAAVEVMGSANTMDSEKAVEPEKVVAAIAPPAEILEPQAAEPVKQVVAAAAVKADGGQVFGDANSNARLVITAKSPVWVRIEDAQGNVVMTQMFNTGDSFRVPDRKGLVVIARDGSRLVYAIDGKERGVMGKPGEILAGEELDIEKLESKS